MELRLLSELYDLVQICFTMFTATTKEIGWRHSWDGKAVRVYNKPPTPYLCVLDSRVLTNDKRIQLEPLFQDTDPAELTHRVTDIRTRLIHLGAATTEVLTRGFASKNPVRHALNF